MELQVVFIIALAIWIFGLQSRLSRLEKIIDTLEDKLYNLKKEYALVDNLNSSNLSSEGLPKATTKEYIAKSIDNNTIKKEIKKDAALAIDKEATAKERYQRSLAKNSKDDKKAYATFKEPIQRRKEPSLIVTFIKSYFTGGNPLVRIGGVVLFFGFAFLVKYASDIGFFTLTMRLWSVAIFAVALTILGWKLKDRDGAYGQVLQGVGVAMGYLLVFATSKYYTFLPINLAFLIMVTIVAIGVALATIENSLPLALFSITGGYMAPILLSTGSGSHLILFSYYMLLNIGVATLAWYRSWRLLNLVGFTFTFIVATAWGALRYTPENFTTTEPFLIGFFLIYLAISIIFTFKHNYEPKDLVDGTLTFGLPLVVFPLQLYLVKNFNWGEAISAITLGSLYLGLWYYLKRIERAKLLSKVFLVLAVIFYTISIPYIFSKDVTSALWAIEATGAIWLSLKQGREKSLLFGVFIMGVSLILFISNNNSNYIEFSQYLVSLIVSASLYLSSYLIEKDKSDTANRIKGVWLIFITTATLIYLYYSALYFSNLSIFSDIQPLIFTLIIMGVSYFIAYKFTNWRALVALISILLPIAFISTVIWLILYYVDTPSSKETLLSGLDIALYSTLFIYEYLMLKNFKGKLKFESIQHLLMLLLLFLVVAVEFNSITLYLIDIVEPRVSWGIVLLIFGTALLLDFLYTSWLKSFKEFYQLYIAGTIALFSLIWEIFAFSIEPSGSYIPILNITDIIQILIITMLGFWIYKNIEKLDKETLNIGAFVVMGLSFILISTILARAISVYMGVEYNLGSLWSNNYLQSGLSIIWSICAVAIMLLSKKYKIRYLWVAGFGLLLVVVAKLFLIELANSGTIERIVSFIVVGLILLAIGYFVPLPPENKRGE